MTDDQKKPDPIEDIRKGLGLLFRAAKTAVDDFPTGKLEEVVKDGAREVSRAIENVTATIEKEVLGKRRPSNPPSAPPTPGAAPPAEGPADEGKAREQDDVKP